MRPTNVSGVISAPKVLTDELREGAKETRLGLTKYAARMAKQAADTGDLEQAPLLKAVADIHSKMHPEAQVSQGLHLSFFSIQAGADTEPDGPVIDVGE